MVGSLDDVVILEVFEVFGFDVVGVVQRDDDLEVLLEGIGLVLGGDDRRAALEDMSKELDVGERREVSHNLID